MGVIEGVIFSENLKVEGGNCVGIWEKRVPSRGNSKCKGHRIV